MKKILFASLVTGGMFLGGGAHAALTHSVADCAPADGKTIEAIFGTKLPTLNQKAVNFALSGEGFVGWLYNGYALASIFKPTNTLTKPSYRTINNGQEECTYTVMNGASQVGSMALIVVEQAAPAATEPAQTTTAPAATEPAPTTAPAATEPAPTTAPAATEPAPTTEPAPATEPAPTTEPAPATEPAPTPAEEPVANATANPANEKAA